MKVHGLRERMFGLWWTVVGRVPSWVCNVYRSVLCSQILASSRVLLGRKIHLSLWFRYPVLRKMTP